MSHFQGLGVQLHHWTISLTHDPRIPMLTAKQTSRTGTYLGIVFKIRSVMTMLYQLTQILTGQCPLIILPKTELLHFERGRICSSFPPQSIDTCLKGRVRGQVCIIAALSLQMHRLSLVLNADVIFINVINQQSTRIILW